MLPQTLVIARMGTVVSSALSVSALSIARDMGIATSSMGHAVARRVGKELAATHPFAMRVVVIMVSVLARTIAAASVLSPWPVIKQTRRTVATMASIASTLPNAQISAVGMEVARLEFVPANLGGHFMIVLVRTALVVVRMGNASVRARAVLAFVMRDGLADHVILLHAQTTARDMAFAKMENAFAIPVTLVKAALLLDALRTAVSMVSA